MNKIFFAFLLTFCAAIPSFAQNFMTQSINNMNMMIAMEDSQKQQQQVQNQAPIVVQIQYQADGTPVITSSAPIQVQTLAPQIQAQSPPPEDSKIGEILLALFLGFFIGSIMTKSLMKQNK